MACGTPVAAYPVTGPIDVVNQGVSGWLDDDISVAVANAPQPRQGLMCGDHGQAQPLGLGLLPQGPGEGVIRVRRQGAGQCLALVGRQARQGTHP